MCFQLRPLLPLLLTDLRTNPSFLDLPATCDFCQTCSFTSPLTAFCVTEIPTRPNGGSGVQHCLEARTFGCFRQGFLITGMIKIKTTILMAS